MKYLKDLEIDSLKINELQDYAEMKEIDLDKEINNILMEGFDKLYKSVVPKERQKLIDFKIEKQNKEKKPQKPVNPSKPLNQNISANKDTNIQMKVL